MERGKANKVEGLEIIEQERIREIEPNIVGLKALYAPNTAIVDYSSIDEYPGEWLGDACYGEPGDGFPWCGKCRALG